jgi:hypothetical protein
MLPLKIPFSSLNVSKCVILYLSRDTGHRSVATYNTNVVSTRSPSNYLNSLNRLASLSWEKRVRIKISLKLSSRRWGKDFSQRWERLTLTTKCYTMLSLNTNKNHRRQVMETSTTKERSTRSGWKTISLAECPLPCVNHLASKRTHLHHGCTICRDMALLQLIKTWKYQVLTLSFLRVWMETTIYRRT